MKEKGTILQNELRERIRNMEAGEGVTLSKLQKILLSIQGPVTTILDVLYCNVNMFIIDQHVENAEKSVAELLDIEIDDEIFYREVILHKNGRPLCYSQSYIPLSRCSDEVTEDLLNKKLTTGNIMDYRHIETVREISNIDIEKITPLLQDLFKTDADLIVREYNMKHKKKIVVHAKEAFPISYFTEM